MNRQTGQGWAVRWGGGHAAAAAAAAVEPREVTTPRGGRGRKKGSGPKRRHAGGGKKKAGTGKGAAVPAVATRGRCADSPNTLIFTLGPMVNWGRVGTGFSPECDAAGWGAGGERGGESQGQDPLPLLQLGKLIPVACALCPHPQEAKGAPKRGG